MSTYSYEIMPSHWYKRRLPTEQKVIKRFVVDNFKKIEGHYCTVTVKYEDGDIVQLNSRVCCSRVYNLDGSVKLEKWTINGINEKGDFILLKVVKLNG